MNNKGLFGPFENSDDINKYWHQVTEKELEESIERMKKESEDPDNSKEDIKIYKQDLKDLSQKLDNLHSFVDNYIRCVERYKFDKKILQQIQDDWRDYNISLYSDWANLQAWLLGPNMLESETLESNQNKSKLERIKREEIEKRIRDLLEK